MVNSFEPEAQNYALLFGNIGSNGVSQRCLPACLAVADHSGFGRLKVPFLTKGGAYNLFDSIVSDVHGAAPSSSPETGSSHGAAPRARAPRSVEQLLYGISLDNLVNEHGFAPPTHVRIDVDSTTACNQGGRLPFR